MFNSYTLNSLRYDPALCVECGMCQVVCPHGVFGAEGGPVQITRGSDCMECGACQRNCPTGAVTVESGVGCAAAMFLAALQRRNMDRCD